MNELEQLKERIEVTRDLMTHPGWKYMHEGWSEELRALTESTLTHCTTEKDLFFRKGAASVLERLVKLAEYLDTVEAALAAQPEDAE